MSAFRRVVIMSRFHFQSYKRVMDPSRYKREAKIRWEYHTILPIHFLETYFHRKKEERKKKERKTERKKEIKEGRKKERNKGREKERKK